MQLRNWMCWAGCGLVALAGAAGAAEKDTRGGTCEDAKSQYEYFCGGKGFQDDIMVKSPPACNNAKRNMAAACDGVVEPDKPYTFEEKTAK